MLGSLVSSGLGSILGGANSLAKTVFGDKAAKEAAEARARQRQAEIQHTHGGKRSKRTAGIPWKQQILRGRFGLNINIRHY